MNQNKTWDTVLQQVTTTEQYQNLQQFIDQQTAPIYPPKDEIFYAFACTPLSEVRVVILGQDPYHGEGQAHGLSFSVRKGCKIPPSLKNIYKELQSDCGVVPPDHGDLTAWAKQGVLLLNTCLTVEEGKAGSHRGKGWEAVTDHVIDTLNDQDDPIVFLLWGAHAMEKSKKITNKNHLVLATVHPSPLSAYRGFFGCGHFSKANEFLQINGRGQINW